VILSKKIFYLILFLLPLNLGKHFIFSGSFVDGLLIDYLVPTLYVQDILIFMLLIVWVYEFFIKSERAVVPTFSQHDLTIFYFFIFSLFLSVLVAPLFNISVLTFARTFLYFLLFLYIYFNISLEKDFNIILSIFVVSFSLVSLLGIFQFIKQSSVFNNYLILGEQPYSLSTRGIRLENVFGFTKVPTYGLFRHPNIFGGLLSVILIWVISRLNASKLYFVPLCLMLSALLFTFSTMSYVSFVLGVFLYLMLTKELSGLRKYLVIILFLLFLFSLSFQSLLPNINISLLRRYQLLQGSYVLLRDHLVYGVGFNSFTIFIESVLGYMGSISFIQPVHNLFMLVLTESGIISLLFLVLIMYTSITRVRGPLLFVSLFQIVFLSFFDHYFWTIHSAHLFLWVILGLCWTIGSNYFYNK